MLGSKYDIKPISIFPSNIPLTHLNNKQINSIQSRNSYASLKSWDFAYYCKRYVNLLIAEHKRIPFECKPISPRSDLIQLILQEKTDTHFLKHITPTVLIFDIANQNFDISFKLCDKHQSAICDPVYHTNIHFDPNGTPSQNKHCLREILSARYYPYILVTTTYKCNACTSSIVSHHEFFLNQLTISQWHSIPVIITAQNAISKQAIYNVMDEINLQSSINKITQLFITKRMQLHNKQHTECIFNCNTKNDVTTAFPDFLREDNSKYILECVKFVYESSLYQKYIKYLRRLNAIPDNTCTRTECQSLHQCKHVEYSLDHTYRTSSKIQVQQNNEYMSTFKAAFTLLNKGNMKQFRFVTDSKQETVIDIIQYQHQIRQIEQYNQMFTNGILDNY